MITATERSTYRCLNLTHWWAHRVPPTVAATVESAFEWLASKLQSTRWMHFVLSAIHSLHAFLLESQIHEIRSTRAKPVTWFLMMLKKEILVMNYLLQSYTWILRTWKRNDGASFLQQCIGFLGATVQWWAGRPSIRGSTVPCGLWQLCNLGKPLKPKVAPAALPSVHE